MKSRRNRRWEDLDKGKMELNQLIQHFEVFNRSEGKSPRTVEWYNEVLYLFLRWLQSESRPTQLEAIGEMEARSFILCLRGKSTNGKPMSTHSVANRVRAMRAFFSWLAQKGYTDEHVLADVRPPRTTEVLIEPLTQEEIECLFGAMNQNAALGARNSAMMALFLDTGLRLSEVAQLKEHDVHLDRRYVKVMGKGQKERMVPLGATCQKALLHYYHHFRPEAAHAGIDRFFVSLDGYAMTNRAISSMMVRLGKASGVTRLHPHLLRHTYATRFLLNGGDVFLLKQNLGHSTLAMVEHYRHIASRQAAILSETFSPLDRMDVKELRRHRQSHNGYGAIYPNAGMSRDNGSSRRLQAAVAASIRPGSTPHRSQSRRASSEVHIRQRT